MDDFEIFKNCKEFYICMLLKNYDEAFEYFKKYDGYILKISNTAILTFYFAYPNEFFHSEIMYFFNLCRTDRSNCKKCCERCYEHQHSLTGPEIKDLSALQSKIKLVRDTVSLNLNFENFNSKTCLKWL